MTPSVSQQEHSPMDYNDLKREVEALRKRIEALECGQGRPKAACRAMCWRRLSSRSALALAAVVVAVLLALGVLGAQNKQDPLFIDQNGNVGIDQSKPESPLDVNGNALFRSDLTVRGKLASAGDIEANNSALYFKGTDHKHSDVGNAQGFAAIENSQDLNALMVLGRTTSTNPLSRIVGIWDRVGIGTGDPKATLDVRGDTTVDGKLGIGKPAPNAKLDVDGDVSVTGPMKIAKGPLTVESNGMMVYGNLTVGAGALIVGKQGIIVANGGMIQGRLWGKEFSLDVSANSNKKLSMTKVATSVCFLTGLYGSLVGRGEMAKITQAGERWELYVQQGGQAGLEATAMCIGSPE